MDHACQEVQHQEEMTTDTVIKKPDQKVPIDTWNKSALKYFFRCDRDSLKNMKGCYSYVEALHCRAILVLG